MVGRFATLILASAVAAPALGAPVPWTSSPIATHEPDLGPGSVSLAAASTTGEFPLAGQLQAIDDATQTEIGDVFLRQIGHGGALGSRASLTTAADAIPTVASDPSGARIVAWREADGIHARRIKPDGTAVADALVIPASAGRRVTRIRVAAEGPNTSVVLGVLASSAGQEIVTASHFGGSWHGAIVHASARTIQSVGLRANTGAETRAVWSETTPAGVTRIRRLLGSAGTWGTPGTVAPGGARWIDVAMGDGNRHPVTIAWIGTGATRTLMTRTRSRAGVWTAPVVHASGVARAAVDTDVNGRVVLAWPYRSSTASGVRLRTGGLGKWSSPTVRSVAVRNARISDLDLDVNPRGDAIVAWQSLSTTHDVAVSAAVRRPAGLGFQPAERRATIDDTRNALSGFTHVAVAPDGVGYATRPQSTGNCCFTLVGDRRSAPPTPVVSNVTLRLRGVPAQDGTVSMTATFVLDRPGRMVASLAPAGSPPRLVGTFDEAAGPSVIVIGGIPADGSTVVFSVGLRPLTGADDPGSGSATLVVPDLRPAA